MAIKNILLICMGNICRSPAAHAIMLELCKRNNLDWKIDSCGTGSYHGGSRPDPRMQKVLEANNIYFDHKSQQFSLAMAYEFDLLLVMDQQNYYCILDQLPSKLRGKLKYLREYDLQAQEPNAEVPDPYYGGKNGFNLVFDMLWRSCQNLIATEA